MAGQPAELALKLTRYLVEDKIRGRRRFPLMALRRYQGLSTGSL
jgi:hypothetical protein